MKLPNTTTSASYALKINYQKYLYPYEQAFFWKKRQVEEEEKTEKRNFKKKNEFIRRIECSIESGLKTHHIWVIITKYRNTYNRH